jgi:hypothetical protein
MAVSRFVAFRKEMMWMRPFVSVWTIETGIPSSNPKVTNRCSSYRKRSSSKVKVAPSNTQGELKRGLSLISSGELRGAAVVALGFRRLAEALGEAREIQVRAASLFERKAGFEKAARLAP